MKETLEREIKLAPDEGFVLPELGGRRMPTRVFISTYHDTADLRLARHGDHVPASRRGRHRALAAEAAARRGPARARGGRPARASAGRARRPAARVPARRRARAGRPPAHPPRGGPGPGRRDRRRQRRRARGPAGLPALPRGRGRADRRRREGAAPAGEGAAQGGRPRDRARCSRSSIGRSTSNGTPGRRRADEGHAARRGARDRARGRLPGAPRPRPGHAPRRRPRGPASASRRDAAAAGVSPRGAPARRSRVGRVAPRGARLARRPSRAGARPRRDARPAAAQRWRRSATTPRPRPGLLAGLEDDRAAAYRDVVETLRGDRYFALLDRLEAAAEPPLSGEEKTLAKIFHREAKRMRRTFDDLGDDPEDDALHASRIAVKRARYAADLAAHELGKPGARFVAVAKRLQDILGDHQDAVVAQERIRDWADAASVRRAASPPAGSSSSSATGWPPPGAAWPDAWQRLDEAAPEGGQLTTSFARPVESSSGHGADGPEVLLVHRPAYDDWTFPKGKARTRRDRGGMRAARGRGGDGPPLHARARAAVDDVQGRRGPAEARALLADGGRRQASSRSSTRSTTRAG